MVESTASTGKLAEVYLWGSKVGSLVWQNERGYFEYSDGFQNSGIELSPIHMPNGKTNYNFGALNRETFKGLPGMLADSLPDKFGNKLIDQWLERQGRKPTDFTSVERLCYIGTRGMGALEFRPVVDNHKEESLPIQIEELVTLANQALNEKGKWSTALEGSEAEKKRAVEKIISVGTSAGGARAKAVIAWNRDTGEVRSGQVPAVDGFGYWLLKFDGVEDNKDHESLADPIGFGIVEYAYYLMADASDIAMTECRLFRENGRSHFMTRRFDRLEGGGKVHMQSLCGMAHFDFNDPGAYSYEQAIGIMRDLKLSAAEMEQFFRRMVFNIVARNQDDHTKNISFLMNRKGQWSLSPAYDITYCNGAGWTSKHQMTVNGKTDNFERTDLLAVAKHADIKQSKADKIISNVINTVKRWPEFAKKAGVPKTKPVLDPKTKKPFVPEHDPDVPTWAESIQRFHRLKL